MANRLDLAGLLIALVGGVAAGLAVAWIGWRLGAPAGVLGALTTAVVSSGVGLIYSWRQRRGASR